MTYHVLMFEFLGCAREQCTFHSSAVNGILQLFCFVYKNAVLDCTMLSSISHEIFGQGYYTTSLQQSSYTCPSPHHITVIQWGQYNGSVKVLYHTRRYSISQSPQHLYNFDCSPVDVPLTSIPFFPHYLYLCTDVLIAVTSLWATLSSCTYRRNTDM